MTLLTVASICNAMSEKRVSSKMLQDTTVVGAYCKVVSLVMVGLCQLRSRDTDANESRLAHALFSSGVMTKSNKSATLPIQLGHQVMHLKQKAFVL